MSERPRKRQFIAGAVCPECQAMDRIVVTGEGSDAQRQCVACGYRDSVKPAGGHLPGTRFSSKAPARNQANPDNPPSPIRILDPSEKFPD